MLCPELVGRDAEVAELRRRVGELVDGRGGVISLVGDAGSGKSRLLHEVGAAASAAGLPVLSGRAAPGASPVPYRPLAEALLTAFRSQPLPDHPSLAGFEPHLGRLVPSWRTATAAEESPVLLAEALVRLLAVLAGGDGCVVLLEELQWSDPETIAVVDYLVDALRTESALCVCTSRPGGAAVALHQRLERLDPNAVVRVDPLGETDVVRMVAACLGAVDPPAGLSSFVRAHSDGNPFLVEELLAGLVAAGGLREDHGHWDVTGPLTPSVPASLRASIEQRLAALDADSRRVLGAAALLGRHFEWELLPGIADVDGRAAADALRAAVGEQLIDVEGDGFVFRHALTREAVLAGLLPPERRELAARAWPVVERANPGLPGPTCELAADLAEAAGDRSAAAERLVVSAGRALAAGALASAEATAERARRLAPAGSDIELDAAEQLLHALVAAGKTAAALDVGRALVLPRRDGGGDPARLASLLVTTARAAVTAGDLAAAAADIDLARATAGLGADEALLARLDAVAAHVALDGGDLAGAEAAATRAIERGRATGQLDVACDALLVMGRVKRAASGPDGVPWFEQAADLAAASGLPSWHLRARHELVLESWPTGSVEPIHETRRLAVRYGAHQTVAVMDLSLADIALSNWDREGCLAAARSCVEASRRYGLATESVANLWLAGAHALGGDGAAMQSAIDAALAKDPDDPRILGDLYGRVLATRAFVADELDTLRPLTEAMIEQVHRAPPHTSIYPGRTLWALLRTLEDDDLGAAARAEFHAFADRVQMRVFLLFGEILEAVALGRAGRAEEATARMEPAYRAMAAVPLSQGTVHSHGILVAEAAIRDGWGDPVRWLRESEAFFAERRFDRTARRCRTVLGEAGAPVPRRRGDTEVPQALRAMGVTGREVDVLKLVVAGCSNKEIAAELVLSPKTVERHLSSLFTRLGVRDRRALAAVGVAHLPN